MQCPEIELNNLLEEIQRAKMEAEMIIDGDSTTGTKDFMNLKTFSSYFFKRFLELFDNLDSLIGISWK